MYDRYDAGKRIKEIENAIRNVQKDGLKVGLKDGKLYVENTSCRNNNVTDNFKYAEIDCFADDSYDLINKDIHYFILMRPLNYIPIIGFCFTSGNDREKWVECKIIEHHDNGFGKIVLQSIEEGYGHEKFYISDFISGIKQGYIIPKERESQHVEEIHWFEPLTEYVDLIHSAYVVTD